jgi:ABC-2 type transport system permease protein
VETLRPYAAVFAGRFQLMLQYRAAAMAGFATQLWFGVIRIMIFAAFYAGGAAGHGPLPMTLANAVAYTWLGQAFLAFLPWSADPEIADMVRSGAVAYERLRPVDTYAWWSVRALAWSVARVLPRALLMLVFAAAVLPLVGLGKWGLAPPPTVQAGLLFCLSIAGVIVLSASLTMVINIVMVASLNDRGINTLAAPFVNVLSGMVVPLAFFPGWLTPILRAQPIAGLADIPFSIYFGGLTGAQAWAGIGLQFGWTAVLIAVGRWQLGGAMARLQIQGG